MEITALAIDNDIEISADEIWQEGPYILQVRELPFRGITYGWGNGYVGLPEGHPWYGKGYDDLEDVDVHGGLTFTDEISYEGKTYWVIGFDTGHYGDDISTWPKNKVREETINLYQQALNVTKN